jgi:hypothetical protein
MEKSLKINIPEGYEIDTEKSTFAEIVFKPIDSLETWKDCIKSLENKGKSFYYITDDSDIDDIDNPTLNFRNYNLLPSEEIAEKFLTLQKLYTCRQAYIGDWKPDFTKHSEPKFCIYGSDNCIRIYTHYRAASIFSFPNRELAMKFLHNFKEDLEFIKDLL